MRYEPIYRGIVVVDIEQFGRRDRTDPIRAHLSGTMKQMFDEGLRHASISQSKRVVKGLGDGLLALVDPNIPKTRLIHPLVPHLVTALEAHNRNASEKAQLRMRVAVHEWTLREPDAGLVHGRGCLC